MMNNAIIFQYLFSTISIAIGLYFIITLYFTNKKTGYPFVGGAFLALGFWLTPYKYLIFLGLILDYGYWYLPYVLIAEWFLNRRFAKVWEEYGFLPQIRDNAKSLQITIKDKEKLQFPYITNLVYTITSPKLYFCVCRNKDGEHNLLIAKNPIRGAIEIVKYQKDGTTIEIPVSKNGEKAMVNIEISN